MDYRTKFKYQRIDHDLLQKDIAKICKVSDATVGHWENLKRHMHVNNIITLCKFYNISADYMLGLIDGSRPLS